MEWSRWTVLVASIVFCRTTMGVDTLSTFAPTTIFYTFAKSTMISEPSKMYPIPKRSAATNVWDIIWRHRDTIVTGASSMIRGRRVRNPKTRTPLLLTSKGIKTESKLSLSWINEAKMRKGKEKVNKANKYRTAFEPL